jgi:hypothetical protein
MTLNLLANLVTVLAAGVLIGLTLRTIPLLFDAQEDEFDAFIEAVMREEPAALERWERMNRLYQRLGPVSMHIDRLPGGGYSYRFERQEGGFRTVVIAAVCIVQQILGLRATLVLLASIGFIVILLVSLLLSPLGLNLIDPVLLLVSIAITYRVAGRFQERADWRARTS